MPAQSEQNESNQVSPQLNRPSSTEVTVDCTAVVLKTSAVSVKPVVCYAQTFHWHPLTDAAVVETTMDYRILPRLVFTSLPRTP